MKGTPTKEEFPRLRDNRTMMASTADPLGASSYKCALDVPRKQDILSALYTQLSISVFAEAPHVRPLLSDLSFCVLRISETLAKCFLLILFASLALLEVEHLRLILLR